MRLSSRKAARASRNPSDSTGNPGQPRISYYAAPKMTSLAAFIKESRMSFAEPIGLNRKSGAAPDFLLRGTKDDLACGFHQGKPHELRRTHRTQQEIRGSPGFPTTRHQR